MPLRAVLYQADLLNHDRKDHHTLHSFFGGSYDHEDDSRHYDTFHIPNNQARNCSYANLSYWSSRPENENNNVTASPSYIQKRGSQKVCPRRRGLGGGINEEVVHHQRLTHIAVERNRRKQVNEYLSTLRSLMPHSYASKGDQASIVGGAINFVKELEQKLQWLGSHKHRNSSTSRNHSSPSSLPFSDFITSSHAYASSDLWSMLETNMNMVNDAANVEVEVSMAECFANLKIRAITGPVKNQLLLRILEHLDDCKLTVLHLNACSVEQYVIYTICMKVEDECNLTSGDEIAAAVHQLLSATASIKHI